MNEDTRNGSPAWGSRMKLALIAFGVIGGFFLIAEHRAHVLPYLPWLLLAACPLMHLFGHGGHGHGGHGREVDRDDRITPDVPHAPNGSDRGGHSAYRHPREG